MKRITALLAALLLLCPLMAAHAEETVIRPQWRVPEHVTWLLEIAGAEVGYKEGAHGYTKYGEHWGDAYAQWCAEYLCWCVDQVDKAHGTALLKQVYPLYSGQNTGMRWFIKQGRWVSRNGNLEEWGYQWFKGEDHFITAGEYIPQPGDWVFFSWTSDGNTSHVAMVEYATKNKDGSVTIHCIEGNNPDRVQRAIYPHNYKLIYGYGTPVRHAYTNVALYDRGDDIQVLEDILVADGVMKPRSQYKDQMDKKLKEGLKSYQRKHKLKVTGVWDLETRTYMENLQKNADTQ